MNEKLEELIKLRIECPERKEINRKMITVFARILLSKIPSIINKENVAVTIPGLNQFSFLISTSKTFILKLVF